MKPVPSNQGSDQLERVLDDVDAGSLMLANEILHIEAERHPPNASCDCALLEALCKLYEQGYRLTKDSQ